MEPTTAEEVYRRHVHPLSPREQLRLLAILARGLAEQPLAPDTTRKRSIMELHGLGREIWEGVDAREYVEGLRDEWDEHP